MNKGFLLKIAGIFMLILLMTWAISYINGIILERQFRNNQVKQDIAKSSAGTQTLIGPILVIPYIEQYTVTTTENNVKKTEVRRDTQWAYFTPAQLELTGGFSNEYKKLGIYKALMYQLGGQMKGTFQLPAGFDIKPTHPNGQITLQEAYISVGISDPRGITEKPIFSFNHQAYPFEQGTQLGSLGNGIHAKLGKLNAVEAQKIPFSLTLNLRGMENFHFTPMADDNVIQLKSSWQHPHFNGSFLPTHKTNASGFDAKWSVSSLASNNQATFLNSFLSNAP
jgi:inner membrane protein